MKRWPLLLLALLALPIPGLAQTLELSKKAPRIRPGVRPTVPVRPPAQIQLKYLGVQTTIDNQVATTQIDQTFHNPNNWQAEGTYLFPLPEGTTVSNFTMYMGGKAVKGEVLDKDKATQVYESVVRKRQNPGMLEFIGHKLIRARVFPIPAKGDVRIKLKFSRVMTADSGWFEYEYPLSSAGKKIGEVNFAITLKSKTPIKTVYSPTHKVHVKRKGDHEVVVRYEKTNISPERGLQLLYGTSQKGVGMHLLTHRRKAAAGYFMLAISPKVELKPEEIVPKSIVFVVDTSGSMAGEKMKQARKALKYCVNSLGEKSHFNIVSFSTEVEAMDEDRMLAATKENRKEALSFVEDLEAAGGTNIDEALEMALELASSRDGLVEVVFLTDGKPTIGERNTKNILKNVKANNKANVRIFVFGIGEELNTHLLDKIAEDNHGARQYVTPSESIERKVSSFYNKIASPVLTNLSLTMGKLATKDMYPKRLPDLFAGGQLLVFGRYTNNGDEPIVLTGKVAGKKKEFVFEAKFAEVEGKNDFLPRLWAQRKVGNLLDTIRLHGENQELRKEVVALAKKFGIITPYTSALVLEDNANHLAMRRDRPVAGGAGGGKKGGNFGRVPSREGKATPKKSDPAKPGADANEPADKGTKRPAPPKANKYKAADLKKESGKKAVELSEKLRKMQQRQSLEEERNADEEDGRGRGGRRAAIKKIGDKTFIQNVDGVWVESTLTEKGKEKQVKGAKAIKYLSKEYFDLVKKHKPLAKYLKVGKKVIIEFEGTVYRIE